MPEADYPERRTFASSWLVAALVLAACSSRGTAHDASPTKVHSAAPETAAPAPRACRALAKAVRLAETPARSLGPGVAWAGSHGVVAWVEDEGDSSHVVAARVGADGPSAPVTVGGTAALPPVAVAAVGESSLVVFGDDRDRTAEVYSRVLGGSGEPRGGEKRLSNAGARDTARGERLGLDLVTGGAQAPSAVGGDGFVAAWTMPQPPRSQVFAALVAEGEPTPIRISEGPSDAWGPALARAGERLAVAWCTGVPGRFEVYVETGGGLTETSHAERIAETAWGPCAPALASVGDAFVVAWVGGDEHDGKVFVAGVSRDGEPGTPHELGPIALRPPGSQIDRLVTAVAVPGGAILVWAGPRPDGSGNLQAALVGPAGEVLAPAAVVDDSTHSPADPAAAAAGDEAIIVWHDSPTPTTPEDIFTLRISCQ